MEDGSRIGLGQGYEKQNTGFQPRFGHLRLNSETPKLPLTCSELFAHCKVGFQRRSPCDLATTQEHASAAT